MRYLISGTRWHSYTIDSPIVVCAFATQFASTDDSDADTAEEKVAKVYLATEIQWARQKMRKIDWPKNKWSPNSIICVRKKSEREIILFLTACKPNWSTNLYAIKSSDTRTRGCSLARSLSSFHPSLWICCIALHMLSTACPIGGISSFIYYFFLSFVLSFDGRFRTRTHTQPRHPCISRLRCTLAQPRYKLITQLINSKINESIKKETREEQQQI